MEPNRAGDVFAWTDANANNSLPLLGNTQLFQNSATMASATSPPTGPNQAGSSFRNITIIGDRLSAAAVNGLAFYGNTQFAYIDNIVIDFLKGRALYAGLADGVGKGNMEESVIQNVRFENDGQPNVGNPPNITPTMEITANSTSAHLSHGSNNLFLNNIRIFQSFGPGLWIHNGSSAISGNGSSIRMLNLKIEGSQISQTTGGGDLLKIGDTAGASYPSPGVGVSEVVGRNIVLDNPVLRYAALRVTGDMASDTQGYDIDGSIQGSSGSPGRGLQVETCQQCAFKFALNNTYDYNVTVGTDPVGNACTGSLIGAPGVIYDETEARAWRRRASIRWQAWQDCCFPRNGRRFRPRPRSKLRKEEAQLRSSLLFRDSDSRFERFRSPRSRSNRSTGAGVWQSWPRR